MFPLTIVLPFLLDRPELDEYHPKSNVYIYLVCSQLTNTPFFHSSMRTFTPDLR